VPFWRPRGCVLWLDLLEPKGDTAYDKSGYDNHGTIYGATRVRTLGRYGLEFDGVDDSVRVGANPYLQFTGDFTIELLFRFIENGKDHGFCVKGYWAASTSDWALPFMTDRRLRLWISNGSVSEARIGKKFLEEKTWYHIVVVFKRKDLSVHFYVNGELDAVRYFTIEPWQYKTWFDIGHSGGWWFNGSIAFIRVYDRALSEREIRANYIYFFSYIKRAV